MAIPKQKMLLIKELSYKCLVEIISHYVGKKGLRQRPINKDEYIGRCPFHKEKTPSFTVPVKKGFYHCFGCGANGDAIRFVKEYESCSYIEAVLKVAKLVGILVPSGPTQAGRARRRNRSKKENANSVKQKSISARYIASPVPTYRLLRKLQQSFK